MDIIFVTTAETDEEARELLTQFGMPFKIRRGNFMAKTSMKVKQQRKGKILYKKYSRCQICGRPCLFKNTEFAESASVS